MLETIQRIECYPDCFCEGHAPFGVLFWTSGAYFLSALLLYFRVRKRTLEFEFWTFTTITLAISSFLFHATQTRVTVALDYASIVMTLLFFPLWNQAKKISRRRKEYLFFVVYFGIWALYMQLSTWFRIGLTFVIFIGVMVNARKEALRFRYHRDLQASVWLAIISFVAFLMEELRIGCIRESICQAHGVWHIGSAIALYLYGRWRFSEN
jgi:hypothetical protein